MLLVLVFRITVGRKKDADKDKSDGKRTKDCKISQKTIILLFFFPIVSSPLIKAKLHTLETNLNERNRVITIFLNHRFKVFVWN